MRIGIDISSGERPQNELIEGVIFSSVIHKNIKFTIFGKESYINQAFPGLKKHTNINIINSNEVISMEDSPIFAVKRKKNSAIVMGVEMLKNKEIDFFFTPGNTGAAVAASVLSIGMIKGIKKPAMSTFFPRMNPESETLILDIGANPEFKEENIYHNAIMGSVFYKLLFEKETPTIGLLNMGTEFGKGNLLSKRAFHLLSTLEGFVGNVESYDVVNGKVDVVVCDGFTGNIILKIAESVGNLIRSRLNSTFGSTKKKASFLKILKSMGIIKIDRNLLHGSLRPRFYGAAPLLGVNESVLIGHGMTRKKDLINAVEFAIELHKKNYLTFFTENVKLKM